VTGAHDPLAVALELCWGTVPDATLPELIDAATVGGFAAVTVKPALYEAARRDGHSDADLRSRAADAGILVTVVDPLITGLPGVPAPADVPADMRSYFAHGEDDAHRVADALGAGVINVVHFLGDASTPLAGLAEAIAGMGARARARGRRLSIEFIPRTGIHDLAAAQAILAAVGLDDVGIMVDTWHLVRSGGGVEDLRALPAGAIAAVQVSDRGEPRARTTPNPAGYVPMTGRLLPGEGLLPLAEILGAVLDNRPGLRVGVEVFSDDLRQLGTAEAARRAGDTTRAVLAQLDHRLDRLA